MMDDPICTHPYDPNCMRCTYREEVDVHIKTVGGETILVHKEIYEKRLAERDRYREALKKISNMSYGLDIQQAQYLAEQALEGRG